MNVRGVMTTGALTCAVLLGGTAAAQKNAPFDIEKLGEDARNTIALGAREAGYHCPKITSLKKLREDVQGWHIRLTCEAFDGTSKWDLLMISLPQSSKPVQFSPL